jgi:uncharacterized membrane protein
MENKEKPQFLSNAPLGEDLFEGKSQDKIATVLEGVLSKKDFQIVGIDGGWGTGKSNLVFMLKKRMNTHSFFIYDVWGHQEDDQRKSILIELTDYLCNREDRLLKNKDKWQNKYKRLLSKEREVTTINRPFLSIGFILSLLLIVYVPSVTAFVKDMEMGFLKISLVLAPLSLIVIIFFWKWIKLFKDNSFKESLKIAVQETFQVYNNKQIDETKTETISENDPSVRDFRLWMKDIDSDLGEKKLVLVFDNFDRLTKRHIQSIWSSIHIFFSEEKYKNIKIIVPFDRAHIKNAFKESADNDYSNDYINKTFDLVYRVSPPIMSDWKSFFKNSWIKAFPAFAEEEYIKVEQIYEVFRPSITPREIIAFINEVVAIRLLDDQIPERYIALFVLNKEVILQDPLNAIVTPEFLSGLGYLYKDDDDFQKYITALCYQINPENALEVVYRKQLKESLVNGDKEQLQIISQTNIFDKILSTVIAEIENYELPIKTLSTLDEQAKISAIHLSNIWQTIYLKVSPLNTNKFEFEEYQSLLIKKITDAQISKFLAKIVSSLYQHKEFQGKNFANIITKINIFLKDNNINVDVFAYLKGTRVAVDEFVTFVNDYPDNWKAFHISCDNIELNQYLIDTPIEQISETAFTKYIYKDYDLKTFTNFLIDNVPSNYADHENLLSILDLLKAISIDSLGVLLSDEQIYSIFTTVKADSELYFDILAMRLARGTKFSTSYIQYFTSQMSTEDEIIAEKIAERVEYYIDYEDLLINSIDSNNDSLLLKSVVRKVVENDYQTNTADIKKLLDVFDDICTINELDPQIFINDLAEWKIPDFDRSLVVKYPNYYFEEAKKSETKLAKITTEKALEYFDKLNTKEWRDIFDNLQSKDASLLTILHYSNWNSFALEALKDHLVSIASTGTLKDTALLTDLLNRFISSGKNLSDLFRDFRDELISARTTDPVFFAVFGQMLFDYAHLEEKSSDVFRTIIKPNLLDDANSINIMNLNSDKIKGMLSSNGDDFKDAIKDRYDIEIIATLASKLGIKRRKENKDD